MVNGSRIYLRGGDDWSTFYLEPQNLLWHPRHFVYFRSKSTLPREFFGLVDSCGLAPGFNFAIFDDFRKKTQGGPLFSKKSVENREKFFPEIIEERVSDLFLGSLAGVQRNFSTTFSLPPPLSRVNLPTDAWHHAA